jgi:hypothetical protein
MVHAPVHSLFVYASILPKLRLQRRFGSMHECTNAFTWFMRQSTRFLFMHRLYQTPAAALFGSIALIEADRIISPRKGHDPPSMRFSGGFMNRSLRIAAAQFPVSGDITRNARYIHAQIKQAAKQRAHVIHFPETALSGYAPQHFSSLADYP